jgi:hypothetical protein
MDERDVLPLGSPAARRAADPLDLARWVEDRLHNSVASCTTTARLYGLEVIDLARLAEMSTCANPSAGAATQAARLTFLAEAGDARALARGGVGATACGFDAAVLAATRWEPSIVPVPRPGEHLVRRRTRTIVVVGECGVATSSRFEHDPEHVLLTRGLAWAGVAGLQLAATWCATRR